MNLKFKLTHLYEKVCRTLAYLPIVWSNEDWDYEFLLILLQFKLKRMYKFFSSDETNVESAPISAYEIGRVMTALDRYLSNDYRRAEFEQIENKYGPTIFRNGDGFTWERCKDDPELGELARNEFKFFASKADEERQDDFEFVFNYMRDNLQKWWD